MTRERNVSERRDARGESRRTEDVFERLGLGREDGIEEHASSRWVHALVDDLEHGARCELVGAEVGEVRREARSEEAVATREVGRVEEPSDEQCSIRARCERDRVENDGNGDSLDVEGAGEGVLERLTSRASAEATGSNLPAAVDHRVEDEVVGRRAEPKSSLDDVVADCRRERAVSLISLAEVEYLQSLRSSGGVNGERFCSIMANSSADCTLEMIF